MRKRGGDTKVLTPSTGAVEAPADLPAPLIAVGPLTRPAEETYNC